MIVLSNNRIIGFVGFVGVDVFNFTYWKTLFVNAVYFVNMATVLFVDVSRGTDNDFCGCFLANFGVTVDPRNKNISMIQSLWSVANSFNVAVIEEINSLLSWKH